MKDNWEQWHETQGVRAELSRARVHDEFRSDFLYGWCHATGLAREVAERVWELWAGLRMSQGDQLAAEAMGYDGGIWQGQAWRES